MLLPHNIIHREPGQVPLGSLVPRSHPLTTKKGSGDTNPWACGNAKNYYVVLVIRVAPPLSGKNQMQVDSPPNPAYNKLFSNATTEIHFPVSIKEQTL